MYIVSPVETAQETLYLGILVLAESFIMVVQFDRYFF